jgi:hypothetical protein
MYDKTPWLGRFANPATRPVQDNNPTPKQVAETVLQELHEPGWIVSFHDADQIDMEGALRILSADVLRRERNG